MSNYLVGPFRNDDRQAAVSRPSLQVLVTASPARTPRPNLQVWVIVAEGFFSRLSFGIISFALPLYAFRLGLSMATIGLLMSLDTIAALVLKPLTGWAADRFGLKRAFVLAIAVRSLVALMLAFAGAPWQLYLIRVTHGLASSLRDPASNALIAEHGGEKTVSSAFAWYHTAKSVAGSIGKTVAGLFLAFSLNNYSLVFAGSFVLSALPLLVVLLFVKEPTVPQPSPAGLGVRRPTRSPLDWRSLLPFIGFGFLVSGTSEMLGRLFPILAIEYAHLNEGQTGMIYTLSIVVVLIAGPLFGWLSDNVSRKLVLMLRGISNVASSLIFMVAPTYAGIASGKLTDDLGKTAFRPAWGSLMAHISGLDRRRRAQAMSWMTMGEDAGEIAGPVLAGFLWATWGVGIALGLRIALAVVTEIYALVLVDTSTRLRTNDSHGDASPDGIRPVVAE